MIFQSEIVKKPVHQSFDPFNMKKDIFFRQKKRLSWNLKMVRYPGNNYFIGSICGLICSILDLIDGSVNYLTFLMSIRLNHSLNPLIVLFCMSA